MDSDESIRVFRIQLFEKGHTFEYIDNMSVQDMCDVMAYHEAESRLSKKG